MYLLTLNKHMMLPAPHCLATESDNGLPLPVFGNVEAPLET